jgi:hypothetical protein
MSAGSLSDRSPRQDGCRKTPSPVRLANAVIDLNKGYMPDTLLLSGRS